MPEGELALQEPPVLPESQGNAGGAVSYLPAALGSLSMVLIFLQPGGARGPLSYVAMGMMGMSAVGMLVSQGMRTAGDRKRRLRGERRDYLRYLSRMRRRIRTAAEQQRRSLAWRHPEPAALPGLAATARLWERRPGHPDFAEARVALGEQRLGLRLTPLETHPVEDLEPLTAHALRRFTRAYTTLADQPIAVALPAYAQVLVHGDADRARALVRAVVAQLTVFHGPDELRLAVVAGPEELRAHWDWTKWLPHLQHDRETDGAGPVRAVVDSAADLESVLPPEFADRPRYQQGAEPARDEPFTVVVLDVPNVPEGSRLDGGGYRNAVVIDVGGALTWKPGRDRLRLRLRTTRPDGRADHAPTAPAPNAVAQHGGTALELVTTNADRKEHATRIGRPDALSPLRAAALARAVSPYRVGGGPGVAPAEPLAEDFALTGLLGIDDLHTLQAPAFWSGRPAADRLRVPIGLAADGSPMLLDIKEAAQGGTGPHGMLIGATGSGKSELLRTLVLGLALTHSSETLNLVLVDFKGGATFLGLDQLPHTSAVITNLADETALVARMQDALHGELMRRQELLRKAGNFSSALEYERARAAGADLAPLPTLFVVVDEFSELLSAHREFMDLFVMIGRLGRSLGVHLLLASQRLDDGRIHQLEGHLSYRIGLRTFSAIESRGVLGVPDAYTLPQQPGNGYLKAGTGQPQRFKAAYVSGEYVRPAAPERRARAEAVTAPFTAAWVAPRQPPAAPAPVAAAPTPLPDEAVDAPSANAPSLLRTAVARMRDAGPAAHAVWLPPLDLAPALDALLPPLTVGPHGYGVDPADPTGLHGALRVPVGVVDRPFDQRRETLYADLSGIGGHLGVAGGPQSGKSTLLRDLVLALAATHTPRQVQFFCLDFGGGALGALAGLPHVGTVTGRLDPERVSRTVAEATGLIAAREQLFAEHGIESMAHYRARRAAGDFADQPFQDLFVVVDGWATVKQDFPELVPPITQIAARGLNFGVHLAVAAGRWSDVTAALRDQLGTRLELRLGDSVDSLVNMRAAATVPKIPGRGITDQRLHYLTAVPRLDGVPGAADLADALTEAVQTLAGAWGGPRAAAVRVLPQLLPAADLPAPAADPDSRDARLPLGLEDRQLSLVTHDFGQTPHLLAVGDGGSGKTNLLRHLIAGITARHTPDEARIILVDVRRGLHDAVPESHRLGYAVTPDAAKKMVAGAVTALKERIPGPEITPAQLRRRDWWQGPRLFVVVDDLDLLPGGPTGPLAGLTELLGHGADIGLHVILGRAAHGVSRAMADPVLRRLQELNTPLVLFSCPPSESLFTPGVKPRQLPPGRALHLTRRAPALLQTPHLPPPADPDA